MQSGSRAWLGLICASLAACSVGTPYRRPSVPLPTEWDAPVPSGANGERDASAGCGRRPIGGMVSAPRASMSFIARHSGATMTSPPRWPECRRRCAAAYRRRATLATVDLGATATRERSSVLLGRPGVYDVFNPVLTASYELDFWGKTARRATRQGGRRCQPLRSADRSPDRGLERATTYFQALELRPVAGRTPHLENGEKILRGLTFEQEVGTRPGSTWRSRRPWCAALCGDPPLEQQLKQTVYALGVLIGAAGVHRGD